MLSPLSAFFPKRLTGWVRNVELWVLDMLLTWMKSQNVFDQAWSDHWIGNYRPPKLGISKLKAPHGAGVLRAQKGPVNNLQWFVFFATKICWIPFRAIGIAPSPWMLNAEIYPQLGAQYGQCDVDRHQLDAQRHHFVHVPAVGSTHEQMLAWISWKITLFRNFQFFRNLENPYLQAHRLVEWKTQKVTSLYRSRLPNWVAGGVASNPFRQHWMLDDKIWNMQVLYSHRTMPWENQVP